MPARTTLAGAALVFAFASAIGFPGPASGEPATTSSPVVVVAAQDDWISVADASGRVILARLLHQGDKLALPEGSGLVFTAGNAGATTLLVDGKPAPALGGEGKVVSNQPLDAALIAAGRLPAQLAQAKTIARAIAKSPETNSGSLQGAAVRAPAEKTGIAPLPEKSEQAPAADVNASGNSRIVVAATADDWISVTDASGKVLLARLLHQGDTLALPEGSGLVFTIGNAGATTLLVDGHPAPPLGGEGEVVRNQPLDPGLIAAGRLPVQRNAAGHAIAPAVGTTADQASPAPAPASQQKEAVTVPAPKVTVTVTSPSLPERAAMPDT
ncbi:MAG: DUF4115 domain-containing protein, partial [Acetobacteraceae bacterium]